MPSGPGRPGVRTVSGGRGDQPTRGWSVPSAKPRSNCAEVEGDQIVERRGLDRIQTIHASRIALQDLGADRLRLDDAERRCRAGRSPHTSARARAARSRPSDLDAEMLGHDRAIGIGSTHRRRLGERLGPRAGLGRLLPACPAPDSVAEEIFAHEADDLFAAPDVVAQKLRDPLQVGAMPGDRVAQVKPTVAQWRVGQGRSARALRARRVAATRDRRSSLSPASVMSRPCWPSRGAAAARRGPGSRDG